MIDYKLELTQKDLALNALKELTQAINANLTKEQLYRIYHFILRGNLNITQMLLFIYHDGWDKATSFGIEISQQDLIQLLDLHQDFDTNNFVRTPLEDFEIKLPIYHQGKLLATVFARAKNILVINADFIQTLSNILVVAIENKRLALEETQKLILQKELDIAQGVQQLLFPKKLPYEKHFKALAFNRPHASVGGDYYDVIQLNPQQTLICVADVSGKGMGAALLMSNFQAALRTLCRQTTYLLTIISELNYLLYDLSQGEKFITAFLAIYNFESKTLDYINAGHQPPFLFEKQDAQKLRRLEKGTTVLGVFEPLPFLQQEQLQVDNFLLFAYTDGLDETFDPEEEEMFGDVRIEKHLKDNLCFDLKVMHHNFFEALNAFKAQTPFNDDITYLSVKIDLP